MLLRGLPGVSFLAYYTQQSDEQPKDVIVLTRDGFEVSMPKNHRYACAHAHSCARAHACARATRRASRRGACRTRPGPRLCIGRAALPGPCPQRGRGASTAQVRCHLILDPLH